MSKPPNKMFFTGHSLYGFPRKSRKTKYQVEVSVRAFNAKDVIDGCCGALHVLFLVSDGSVFGVGNNEYGQLGLEKKKLLTFTKIPIPKPVVSIDAGDTHSAFLCDDGSVFICGTMDHSDAFKSITHKKPTLVPVPSGVFFKRVRCGYKRIYALSETGNLYGMGNNHCGVLGVGQSEVFVETFKKMKFSKTIRDISCGKDHTIILGSDGKVYGLGSDDNGQLGLLRRRQSYPVPTLIPTLEKKSINRIKCGSHHSVFLSGTKKSVFVTGRNNMGQLGLGHVRDCGQPTQLFHYRFAGKASIVDVFCGHSFTFFLSSSDKVFGCGKNESGQLGIGTLLKPYQPFEVKGAAGTRGIFCGRSFTFHLRGQKKRRVKRPSGGRRRPVRPKDNSLNQSMPVIPTDSIPREEEVVQPAINKQPQQEKQEEVGNKTNKEQVKKIKNLEREVKKINFEKEDLQVRLKRYEDPEQAKFFERFTSVRVCLENQVEHSSKQKDFEKCIDIQKIIDQIKEVKGENKESLLLLETLENSEFLFT